MLEPGQVPEQRRSNGFNMDHSVRVTNPALTPDGPDWCSSVAMVTKSKWTLSQLCVLLVLLKKSPPERRRRKRLLVVSVSASVPPPSPASSLPLFPLKHEDELFSFPLITMNHICKISHSGDKAHALICRATVAQGRRGRTGHLCHPRGRTV